MFVSVPDDSIDRVDPPAVLFQPEFRYLSLASIVLSSDVSAGDG